MTPFDCFRAKVSKGIVSEKAAQRLEETAEAFRQERDRRAQKAEDAAMSAAAAAADDAAKVAAREADLALRSIEAQLRALDTFKTVTERMNVRRANRQAPVLEGNNSPESDTYTAFSSLLDRDPGERGGWDNVTYKTKDLRAEAHKIAADGITRYRSTIAQQFKAALPEKLVGKPDRTGDLELLGAFYGKADAPPEARGAARSFGDAMEWLRQMFVDAGGALPKRENWRLPNPMHESTRVRSVLKQDWIDFVWDKLDRDAMLDFDTGRKLSNETLTRLLSETYDTIAADGATGAPTSGVTGKGALASSRAQHRFLVFRTAEDWLAYDAAFGKGIGVFDTIMHHIEAMAQDIAMVQILGPNPEATIRFMQSVMDRERVRLGQAAPISDPAAVRAAYDRNAKIASTISNDKAALQKLFEEVSGKASVPTNIVLASRFASARAFITAAKLGSAALSQIADLGGMISTARFNGIPVTDLIVQVIKDGFDRNSEIDALQLGLSAHGLGLTFRDNDRVMGETIASHKAQNLASAVIRVSGMRRLTGIERTAFAKTQMATYANALKHDWTGLEPRQRAALERYELSSADWDVIRKARALDLHGARFLTAYDIRAVDGGGGRIADAYQRMLNTELDYAVLDTDPRVRAQTIGSFGAPGTWMGEIGRSMMHLKSFAFMMLSHHGARATAYGWDGSRLAHGASTLIAMTVFGMLAMQMKEIAKGRDPISMDPKTGIGARAWGAAVLQGGGLGIFGDLLFQDQTRVQTSLASTLAGPLVGDIERVAGDWLMKNVYLAAKGQQTHFTGDALYAFAGLVPGQSLWYARTAFQRAVLDRLALMIDDRAPERFQRIEREAEKSWGQRFWWEPGASTPRRAPDPAAALGGSR